MPQIEWSEPALDDLSRLYSFLAEKNQNAAERAIRRIRADIRALSIHPQLGRRVPDFLPELRDWAIEFGSSGYIARYLHDGERIVILAIRHAREAGF